MTVAELRTECRRLNLRGYSKLRKADLVALIAGDVVVGDGISPRHTVASLRAEAKRRGLHGYSKLRKSELLTLLGMRPRTDDDELVAAIASLPPSLSETRALAKYLIGNTTPAVVEMMKDQERRGVAVVRDRQQTVQGWNRWHAKYLALAGVTGMAAAN